MELRQLVTFRELARTLNFTRTAAALNYVQSNVTAQIQALEEELGVRLFDRLGKRVVLTEVGERLLRYADQIVDLTDEMYKVASTEEEPRGTLTMSAAEPLCTYLVPRLFYQMRNRYPHVQIVFRPFQAPDVCQLVREGTLDIALALEEPIHSAKLMTKPLFPERLQVIAAPSHPLAGAERLETADLEGETIIVTENKCSYRSFFERSLADADVQPAEIIEVTTVEAIKQCIMVGMGISILPEIATRTEIERGTIVVLPWQFPNVTVFTQLVWHREKWLSPALHAFIDTATTMQW